MVRRDLQKHRFDLLQIPHVAGDRRQCAQLFARRGHAFGVDIRQDHVKAFGLQRFGRGQADALSPTRDERNRFVCHVLILQIRNLVWLVPP